MPKVETAEERYIIGHFFLNRNTEEHWIETLNKILFAIDIDLDAYIEKYTNPSQEIETFDRYDRIEKKPESNPDIDLSLIKYDVHELSSFPTPIIVYVPSNAKLEMAPSASSFILEKALFYIVKNYPNIDLYFLNGLDKAKKKIKDLSPKYPGNFRELYQIRVIETHYDIAKEEYLIRVNFITKLQVTHPFYSLIRWGTEISTEELKKKYKYL